jgi:tRNA-specific 2-thiouridylase
MSGGVDSSTVAASLVRDGHQVFGVTMKLHNMSEQAIEDAQKIASFLGIEHFIADFSEEFEKKIIKMFREYYASGLTPNPCAFCNKYIKMQLLLGFAKARGADTLATGHYAIISLESNQVFLKESKNKTKDQSYFLSLVPKNNLKDVAFPLGYFESKDETRKLAAALGLPNFAKKDSQDVCFIPNGDYKSFLPKGNPRIGEIVHKINGKILGKHDGIENYTVGQRRGVGVAYNKPIYVVDLDPVTNTVFVGERDLLDIESFPVRDMNWIVECSDLFEAKVKIRSSLDKVRAVVKKVNESETEIKLLEPSINAVTKGQICAIYENDKVLAGGVIS